MFRILITTIVVLFGLLGMGAEEGSCEVPEDNTPTSKTAPTATTGSDPYATRSRNIPDVRVPQEVLAQGCEAKALYEELKNFREKDDFQRQGFAVNGPYHGWMKRAESLQKRASLKFWETYGFAAGDVTVLGMEYVSGSGSEALERRLIKGLRKVDGC